MARKKFGSPPEMHWKQVKKDAKNMASELRVARNYAKMNACANAWRTLIDAAWSGGATQAHSRSLGPYRRRRGKQGENYKRILGATKFVARHCPILAKGY